ncbi:antichymotrypsin-2-like [Venturia canescens]|uniref:antichymotrypsin-2-like n=1 Tax=Venturia canescens TaxID=32260 RepID=UPI001C9C0A9E|nr:antichymotrypsin-2-like [Venturia canescens]
MAEGQQLVLDIARNFSSSYFESLTLNAPFDGIVSPLSFFIPLSMLSFGARGKTRRIFLDALGLPKNKTHLAAFGYEDFLDNLNEYDVHVKTKIFVPSDVTLKPNFVNTSTEIFNAEIETVNVTNGLMDTGKMNEWIAAQTNNNVTELIKLEEISRNLSIVLANTVYFRGTWQQKFLSSETGPRPFHPVNGQPFPVLTMVAEGRFRQGRIDEFNCSFLEIPYKSSSANNAMSMFVLLPDKGQYLEWSLLVQFFAPAVTREDQTKKYPKTADFSGIFESSGKLNINGESLMKIVIEIDEEGQRTAESSGQLKHKLLADFRKLLRKIIRLLVIEF